MEEIVTYASNNEGNILPIYRVIEAESISFSTSIPVGYTENELLTSQDYQDHLDAIAQDMENARLAAVQASEDYLADVAARKAALMTKLDLTQDEIDLLVNP